MTSKQEMRLAIRALLRGMSSRERSAESLQVFEKLATKHWFLNATKVGVYVSLERELKTESILEFCWKREKRLFSEKDFKQMKEKEFRIKQFVETDGRPEALSSGGLDVVLVPGVAFTRFGHRLGNGFAFYDNWLKKCVDSGCRPLVVGLAFTKQMVDWIPSEKHDFKMDCVLFP